MARQPRLLLEQAVRSLKADDRDGVAEALRTLVADAPPLADQWGPVARMASAIGEIDLAEQAMRHLVAAAPRDEAKRLAYAAFLAEAGRALRAIEVLTPVAGHGAASPQVNHLLATLHAQLGRFDAARELFRQVLSVWPLSGHSWLGLAAIRRYRLGDPELERLEAQRAAMAGASAEARSAYLYALGKAYDDAGAVDESFAAFTQGAGLIAPMRAYDREAAEAQVNAIVREWDARALAELKAEPGIRTGRPIFVTGIPRSGTTLVEQMLVSHSSVDGGGEVNLFAHVLRPIRGGTLAAARHHARASGGPRAAWRRAAELYLHLLDQRIPGQGHAIDKTLNSSRSLGLISIILPEAPLIWVRRDPLDVAWSCFRTMFSKGVPWSWRQEDIAHHVRSEERLLAHWREVLGRRLLVLSYENLVERPEEEGARILAHCGLPPESLGAFHETERAVTTSSAAQVRQPLYRGSVGAAERYRAHLQPFIAAYESGA